MKKISINILILFLLLNFSSCLEKRQAKVVVDQVTLNSDTSALVVLNLIDLGEENISRVGVCWSKNENPTINDNVTFYNGKFEIGVFSVKISSLEENVSYNIRAFVEEGGVIKYSETKNFTFNNIFPKVSTVQVTNIDNYSAIVIGNVSSDNGYSLTKVGTCISTTINPTVDSCLYFSQEYPVEGAFYSDLYNLSPQTAYM